MSGRAIGWLLGLSLLALGVVAAAPAPGPAKKEIKMFAQNWKWTPDQIRVAAGTQLRITIQNVDSPHRFQLKGYDVDVALPEDETVVVEFVADRAGEFKWRCARPCGNGCPKMTGVLIVE